MYSVVFFHEDENSLIENDISCVEVDIENTSFFCGLIGVPGFDFDSNDPSNDYAILVKKNAFSCNFRDIGAIFKSKQHFEKLTKGQNNQINFSFFGSEFSGEVLDVGSKVTQFKKGDRVFSNSSYAPEDIKHSYYGLATQQASQRMEILHEEKLLKIPEGMSDEEAASFTIGAQTVMSMVRKLEIVEGANILITSASSNTSLFALNYLKNKSATISVLSSSNKNTQKFIDMGAENVYQLNTQDLTIENENCDLLHDNSFRGFDYVIDPFIDLNIPAVGKYLNLNAKYASCGALQQFRGEKSTKKVDTDALHLALRKCIIDNVTIIGNCLGTTQDLKDASEEFTKGNLKVEIDAIYSVEGLQEFIEKSFNTIEKFGKVVFKF